MSSYCAGCHAPINENTAIMAREGRIYHTRCAPAAQPEKSFGWKLGALAWLAAPGCLVLLVLWLLFPLPMLFLTLMAPIALVWLWGAKKIKDSLR